MNELIANLVGIATLKEPVYVRLRDSKTAMRTGVLTLLTVFLIAGSSQFVMDMLQVAQGGAAQEAVELQEEFRQGLEQAFQFMPEDATQEIVTEQILQNAEVGFAIMADIANLPTPLPRGIGGFFQALGRWLSNPLGHLAAWMSYAIWVLLFAKLLGGKGGVDRFLGVTAMYAVPGLLSFFSPIACLGGLLGLVAIVWGWIIYVKAVQVSQRFDLGKAVLASVLPFLIVFIIGILAATFGVISLIAATAGGG